MAQWNSSITLGLLPVWSGRLFVNSVDVVLLAYGYGLPNLSRWLQSTTDDHLFTSLLYYRLCRLHVGLGLGLQGQRTPFGAMADDDYYYNAGQGNNKRHNDRLGIRGRSSSSW